MSKFDEMVQARVQCTKTWIEYRNRSYKNLMTLAQGFIAYCDIPEDCFALAPLDKDIEPNTNYGPAGAIHFDSADNFWHLGMIVTLREAPNVFPRPRVLLGVAIKEQAGKIIVKRGKEDKAREVDLSNEEQCNGLYDSIVERVKQFYSVSPDNVAGDDTSSLRRIGFTAG
jgi:hypothetical protein